MRRFIAIILMGGVFTQIFFGSGLLIDYYVNSDTYKALCENKSRPELKCDGKCILAHKLAQSRADQEQKDGADRPPIPVISTQYLPSFFLFGYSRTESWLTHRSKLLTPAAKDLIFSLFKPPQ